MVFDFLQTNPYHIDALYDIGDFFRLQGNFKEANRLLERILFLYEDCFSNEFKQIFEDVQNQYALSFDDTPYNKTLFYSLLKFIDILGKKGCFKAALEYNKFLLKLNPSEDPIGALLCLDYYCISSKQYEFLQYFTRHFASQLYKDAKFSILYMPNYIYSNALAKYLQRSEKEPNTEALIKFTAEDMQKALDFTRDHREDGANVLILVAILLYPRLLLELATKNDFQKLQTSHSSLQGSQKLSFKQIFEHKFFVDSATSMPFYSFLQLVNEGDIQGVFKIFEIYVERTKIVWKANSVALWLKAAAGFLLNFISENQSWDYEKFVENMLTLNIQQNIIPFQFSRYK